MYLYDAKTNSFFSDELKDDYLRAGSWPEAALPITDKRYQQILEGVARGWVLRADKKGAPVLEPPAPETDQEVTRRVEQEKQRLTNVAETRIAILERAVRLVMATAEEQTLLSAWERYSVLLSRVVPGPGEILWPPLPEPDLRR